MKIIKLTSTQGNVPYRVNFSNVLHYHRYADDKYTHIRFSVPKAEGSAFGINVIETPEQIDELLGIAPVVFEQSIA